MNQYDAIFIRRTIKNFKTDSISDRCISQILNFANYITDMSEKNSVNFEIWSCREKDKLLEHHFSVKAPYYFVVSTDNMDDKFLNLGFVLEQVALYLVTKDIGSSFAGLRKEKRIRTDSNGVTGSGYEIIAVLAFGIPEDEPSYGRKQRQLPLEHVCVFKDKSEPNIREMIRAAIQVPSRMNSQPWRFVVVKNRIHVFRKRERLSFKSASTEWYHQFDIGMMLANLLIAGEELWYNTEIVKSENIAEKELKNNIYMFTVIVTEQQSDFDKKESER